LTDILLLLLYILCIIYIQEDDSFHVRHRNTSAVDIIMSVISLTDFDLVFTVSAFNTILVAYIIRTYRSKNQKQKNQR